MAEAETLRAESIRGLFIPLTEGFTLLLPGSVIAEVVTYQEPAIAQGMESHSHWLLGRISWRGMEVPLVSMEGVMVGKPSELGERRRIIILKAVGNRPGFPYFGVVARQIPRLVTLQQETVEPLEESGDLPGVHGEVLANGEPALIPDVEALEALIYQTLYKR